MTPYVHQAYPRMLYRSDDGVTVVHTVVADAAAAAAHLGVWSLGPTEALAHYQAQHVTVPPAKPKKKVA